jgi:hypothetical protein
MTFPALDPKDPDAEVFYEWDFTNWLGVGETISSYTFPGFPAALTNESDSEASGVVQMKISGGADGTSHDLTCRIVTSAGQTEDRTFNLPITET